MNSSNLRAVFALAVWASLFQFLPVALGDEPAESRPHLTPTEIFNEMLPSTVWLRVQWVDGNMIYSSWGTGWVFDVDRRLVVTNEHVVHGRDEMTAYFPQWVDGELQHEPAYYIEHGQKFTATVIDRDTERDLALVQLDGLSDDAIALSLAEESPDPGERIFALASLPEGSEGLWIMTSGEVRQVYRRSNANGHFEKVVETQLPTNRGNSGGAVVNDQLEVVAVVEGHMLEARLVSLFVDIGEIHDYLDESAPLANPTTAEEFETRGSRRYDESRYDGAISDYTESLRLEPKRASALLNRGWTFLVREDYETAIADFDAALKSDPEMSSAYKGRGTCYREQGKYDEAIRDLTEAIRRDASDADSYERRAKCYQATERYQDALKDRNRAVELAADDPDYVMQRGQTQRALKHFDEARQDFEKAIGLNPASAVGYYELGWVYFDQEQYQPAKFYWTMAMERDANETTYVNMRGLSSLRMEQYDEAAADFSKAIQLNPQSATYHWHLGLALDYMGRYPEAIASYTQSIVLDPEDAKVYSARADCYEELGDESAAAADRAKAEELAE